MKAMKIKPINTEFNRTALAEKIVQSLSLEALYDYAVYVMASGYDEDPEAFYHDWEQWNDDNE